MSHIDSSEIILGVVEYVESIRAKGVQTAIGSASKNAMLILDRLGITSLFATSMDGNKVSRAKPDPKVFLRAAEDLNMNV